MHTRFEIFSAARTGGETHGQELEWLLPGGRRALLGSGELIDSESGRVRPRALGGALAGPVVSRSGRWVLGTTDAGVVEVPLPAGTPVTTIVPAAAEPALSRDETQHAYVRREGHGSELWVAARAGSDAASRPNNVEHSTTAADSTTGMYFSQRGS